MTDKSARADLLAVACLLAAALLAFSDVLGPSRGLFFRDHILVFKPLWWSIVSALEAGHWPAFTVTHPDGMPVDGLVANAMYTPAALLFFFGRFSTTYDLFVLFHVVFLGVGVYFLARRLLLPWASALAAALVAALGGPVLSFENLVVGLQGLACVPWIGWAALHVLRCPSRRSAAILALPVALQAQALMPELLLLDVGLFSFLYLAVRPRLDRRLILTLACGGLLGILLVAVELGPLYEALSGSRRLSGFGASERSGWALSPLSFLELFSPAFWAPPELPFLNVPMATGSAEDPPYLTSLYLGAAIPVALAVSWQPKHVRWLVGLAVLTLLVALGSRTPLHGWLSSLPILRNSRYAIKYMVIFDALVAALVAQTLLHFRERASRVALWAILQGAVLLALWVTAGGDGWRELLATSTQPLKSVGAFTAFKDTDVIALFSEAMQQRLAFASVGVVLVALVGLGAFLRPDRAQGMAVCIAAILAADLGFAGRFAIVGANVEGSIPPAEVTQIAGGRQQRVCISPPPPTAHREGQTYFEDFVLNQGHLGFSAYETLRRYFDLDLDGQGNELHRAIYRLSGKAPWPLGVRWLERAGVHHLISSRQEPGERVHTYTGFNGQPVYVYRVNGASAYVQALTRWKSVGSTPEALTTALTGPLDLGVIIDAEDVQSQTASCAAAANLISAESTPERLVIQSEAACPALVVAQEVPMPRWHATIDGASAPVRTAEAGYLAVITPPGKHRVVFEYRSATSSYAWFSVVGLAVWLFLVLWPPVRK